VCFVGRLCMPGERPYSWLASYLGSDFGTATGSASNTSMPAERRFVKMSILSSHLGRTVNIPEKYAVAPGTPCGQYISKKRPSRFVILSAAQDLCPARDPALRSG